MGEPTDVVSEAIQRFNSGDVEGFVSLHHEDAVMHDVPEIPDSGVYRGRDGIRSWAESVLQPVEAIRFEISDPLEHGELVAIGTRAVATGRESGIELDWSFTTVWGVRDGLIYYHHGYTSRDDAEQAIAAG